MVSIEQNWLVKNFVCMTMYQESTKQMTNKIVKEKSETMNHVLFLDFDGPLFPDRYISFHRDNRRPYPGSVEMPDIVSYWKMDPLAVEMLNFLNDTFKFQTVVSSSWKRFIDKDQCIDLFNTNGLGLSLADDWATIELRDRPWKSCGRAAEISEFVNRHSIEEYIIIDDPMSGSSLDDQNGHNLAEDRIILINPDLGLGTHDYRQMINIVKKWAGISPPLW
jgi:hypothetical protein